MSSSDLVVALNQGAVDAAWVSEPNAALAIQKGYAVPWKVANDVQPGAQDSTIFYNGDWARKNPKLAQAFMNGYVCGVKYYLAGINETGRRKEILKVLSDYTSTSEDLLTNAQPPGYFDNGVPNLDSIQKVLDSFHALGLTRARVSADELVDLSYVQAAADVHCE